MNLFTEIAGHGGETLTSAVLRYLVLRSQDVREVLVSALSEVSRQGPLRVESHFSCALQVSLG